MSVWDRREKHVCLKPTHRPYANDRDGQPTANMQVECGATEFEYRDTRKVCGYCGTTEGNVHVPECYNRGKPAYQEKKTEGERVYCKPNGHDQGVN